MKFFGESCAQQHLVFFDVVEEIFTGADEAGLFFIIVIITGNFRLNHDD
jgi:hypothetical protein